MIHQFHREVVQSNHRVKRQTSKIRARRPTRHHQSKVQGKKSLPMLSSLARAALDRVRDVVGVDAEAQQQRVMNGVT